MNRIEDKLQMECLKWFWLQYPKVTILHPKNEGNRKSLVTKANGKSYSPDGVRNKKMGVLAGTPDLFVMKSKDNFMKPHEVFKYFNGLWIELKTHGGKQSPAQKEFEAKAIEVGYAYRVCRSIDEFMKVVNEYLT